jgi:hypothetical protein
MAYWPLLGKLSLELAPQQKYLATGSVYRYFDLVYRSNDLYLRSVKESVMLEPLLGSTNCERVLIFLAAREEGYLREISDFFVTSPAPILKQLEKLENGGVLFSRLAGRTRLYGFNPRYPFLNELKSLLDKALTFYPEDIRARLLESRRRPRRKGKPL